MPLDRQHAEQARLNEEFADSLDVEVAINDCWSVIAAFYAALHHVEIYFALKNEHLRDHREREYRLQSDPSLQPILSPYKYLQSLSELARYKCALPARSYKTQAKARLGVVKAHIVRLLPPPPPPPRPVVKFQEEPARATPGKPRP